jgi:hypothetical protein
MTPLVFRNPKGSCLDFLNISQDIVECIKKNDWNKIDNIFQILTAPKGAIFEHLLNYIYFTKIETMISIRDSQNDWEEDGIWHDDGSRVFAFSLSLTINPDQIFGGRLGVRSKGSTDDETRFS